MRVNYGHLLLLRHLRPVVAGADDESLFSGQYGVAMACKAARLDHQTGRMSQRLNHLSQLSISFLAFLEMT